MAYICKQCGERIFNKVINTCKDCNKNICNNCLIELLCIDCFIDSDSMKKLNSELLYLLNYEPQIS